ncbi:hypothetical protein GE061_016187 [Apolygus lucorum]|uniref:Proteasome inhibitor PI31 subunit n=1 Tax=Apolygus lucorum TaxID=248454 RepID=A0A6A4JHG9_APOLU|nr:hypothetical protein GE061_016187 [Apolygus lucorum]
MTDLLGWEPMYRVSENDLKKKEDVLLLVIHYILTKNGYRCVGLGDDKNLTGSEVSSELLPNGWNAAKNYTLRYTRDNELYILRSVPVDDNMVVNLLKVSSLLVSNVAFNVECTVAALRGSLDVMVTSSETVFNRIKTDLLEPQNSSSNSANATTQTTVVPDQPRPVAPVDPHPYGYLPERNPQIDPFWVDPERDPLRVGARDLDPFARGGGMIFNPFEPRHGGIPDPGAGIPGGLPRGSIPPGARFDPFGPPGLGRGPRRPPDSDPGGFPGMFL